MSSTVKCIACKHFSKNKKTCIHPIFYEVIYDPIYGNKLSTIRREYTIDYQELNKYNNCKYFEKRSWYNFI